MKHTTYFLSAILLLFTFAWTGELGTDGGTPVTDDDPWQEAFPVEDGVSLSSVWGTDAEHVYVVGGNDTTSAIYFFDGTTWSRLADVPDASLLAWIYGFGQDDIFAVGWDGVALHYDGTTWTELDSGTTSPLWGVWGSDSENVYAVGGEQGFGAPVLLEYDGGSFTPVVIAESENPTDANALFKVWGIDGRVFAVGQDGLILERQPSGQWQRQDAGPDAVEDFVALWGTSAENIIAVGGRSNAQIATFDGTSWTTTLPLGVGGLSAISILPSGDAIIGGVSGMLGTFNMIEKTVQFEESPARIDIHAAWTDPRGVVYAVGGTFFPTAHQAVALQRKVDE